MAEVWLATDQALARPVAVKVLKAQLAADPVVAERFRREAVAAAGLTHPNIVHIYELRSDANQDFIVMEFVRGRTLTEVLAERSLTVDEVLAYAEQIVSALAAAHSARRTLALVRSTRAVRCRRSP